MGFIDTSVICLRSRLHFIRRVKTSHYWKTHVTYARKWLPIKENFGNKDGRTIFGWLTMQLGTHGEISETGSNDARQTTANRESFRFGYAAECSCCNGLEGRFTPSSPALHFDHCGNYDLTSKTTFKVPTSFLQNHEVVSVSYHSIKMKGILKKTILLGVQSNLLKPQGTFCPLTTAPKGKCL